MHTCIDFRTLCLLSSGRKVFGDVKSNTVADSRQEMHQNWNNLPTEKIYITTNIVHFQILPFKFSLNPYKKITFILCDRY